MLIKPLKILAAAVVMAGTALALTPGTAMAEGLHRIVIHVDDNDPKRMNMALNNAANIDAYYKERLDEVLIEIVAYGPGLNMLVAGKSPVAERIASFESNFDNITFKACGNTLKNMTKKAGMAVPLLSQAQVIPSGVVYLSERQEQGWSYIRP